MLDFDIMLFGDVVINSECLIVLYYDMKNCGFMFWLLFEIVLDFYFFDGLVLCVVLDNFGVEKFVSW